MESKPPSTMTDPATPELPSAPKALQPLIVDLYEGDVAGRPVNIPVLAADRRFNGIIVKATEGTYYRPPWFTDGWDGLKGVRTTQRTYGEDWFRGAYHFLKFNESGVDQADYYLSAVERSGGWGIGDFWPIVDVEAGGERNSNQDATPDQVQACVGSFAAAVRAKTGRKVMLYGNGIMRDLAIKSKMGCDYLWLPRYTSTLPPFIYERAGWTQEDLVMWQYCGDGQGYLEGYPTSAPGVGRCDISVMVLNGGLGALKGMLY